MVNNFKKVTKFKKKIKNNKELTCDDTSLTMLHQNEIDLIIKYFKKY